MKLLFYVGTFTHQFYKEQFKFFPHKIDLIPSSSDLLEKGIRKDYLNDGFKSFLMAKIRNIGLKVFNILKIPKYIKIKNLQNADFVYSAQYLVKNDIEYVSDFEHAAVYSWYNQKLFDSKIFQSKLRNIFLKKNLKFLLPWTDAARQSLLRSMDCSDFKDKIKIVYPAIEKKKFNKINHKGINVLFVGGAFYLKGGMDSILAFDKVRAEMPNDKVNLTIVSNGVPKEVVEKYKSYVNFKSKISQEKLVEEYCKSDIFIMPTHMDTFGFVLLEAMSYGLPCISIDTYAVPEIIRNGKTGFVVHNSISLYDKNFRYKFNMLDKKENAIFSDMCKNPNEKDVEALAVALKKLIADSPLRAEMSKKCLDEIEIGRFSKKRRIDTLKKLLF